MHNRAVIRMGYGTIDVLDLPALDKLAHRALSRVI